MKKIEKEKADAYFKARTTSIVIYLIIGFIVSYVMIFNAEALNNVLINGMPAHYFMGAQGAILTFIILLFVNAIVSDRIDKKFGIDESANERASSGKALDH